MAALNELAEAYRNRTLDDLLIRASQVSFRPERQRLYARAQGMLAEGQTFLVSAPWVAFFPGAALLLAVLGINLLGDALRDLLDPRFQP